MFEVNDLIVNQSYRAKVPWNMRGTVIKVYKNHVKVKWDRTRRLTFWYRGQFIHGDELPEVSRIAKYNIGLVERRGGPW